MTTSQRAVRRSAEGVVTSDKMQKTRRVEISHLVKHARYGKYIRKRTICHVHDELRMNRTLATGSRSWKPGLCPRPRTGGSCGFW